MESIVFAYFAFYPGLIPVNIKEKLMKNRHTRQKDLIHKTWRLGNLLGETGDFHLSICRGQRSVLTLNCVMTGSLSCSSAVHSRLDAGKLLGKPSVAQ